MPTLVHSCQLRSFRLRPPRADGPGASERIGSLKVIADGPQLKRMDEIGLADNPLKAPLRIENQ